MNFHHFANIRKAININKDFYFFYIFTFFLNDVILQWVLELVSKYKNILTNLHMQYRL
jgi:hypothetical protein